MENPLHIPFELLEADALPADERELLAQAMEASALAYAPWSRFQVGCALQMVDGSVMTGNNQENPAFPSSLCAERTALYYAGAQGKGADIRKIAIRASSLEKVIDQPATPCGACRQVMLEYERLARTDLVVLMQGKEGKVLKVNGVGKTLLPFGFDIEF